MNNTRSLPADKTSNQNDAGSPNSGSRLQVSSSALSFDHTDPGDESFLTLRITPPHPNTLVVVSINDESFFQVAAGVERLAFKQALTFKPELTGSYIHLRYTPERSGRHQAMMTVEAPATAETLTVSLTGRTTGIALPGSSLALPAGQPAGKALQPATSRPINALTRTLLVGGLLIGIGYAGYTYRCQLWPASCGPVNTATTSPVRQEPNAPEVAPDRSTVAKTRPVPEEPESKPMPDVVERAAEPVSSRSNETRSRPTESGTKRSTAPTDVPGAVVTRSKQTDNVPIQNRDVKTEKGADVADRKSTAVTKPTTPQRTQPTPVVPKPKPVTKPANSDESELERVLNRGSN